MRPNDAATDRLGWWKAHHGHVLEVKGLSSDQVIVDALSIDRANTMAAIGSVPRTTNAEVTEAVFEGDVGLVTCATEFTEGRFVDHLGFRIYAPLDVFMDALKVWLDDASLTLVGTKRFPISDNFQRRVGARVEMAQAWIASEEGDVELEIFDIVKPMADASEIGTRARMIGPEGTAESADPLTPSALLVYDDIWHFGVRIDSVSGVQTIHNELVKRTASADTLRLLNDAIVGNRWHGSVHTKVRNERQDLEVEFLTYQVDWDDQ